MEMQLHHRKSNRSKKKKPVRVVRCSNLQDEALPVASKKLGTTANDWDKGQATVTPSPKHTAKSKTPSSPKDTSSEQKKVTTTLELSIETEQPKQEETEILVRVRKGNATKNEKDDEELLPVVNTITPLTKSREPTVSRASPAEADDEQQREAHELLAMSNSMNMEAVRAQQPDKEPHQNESLKRKAEEIDTSPPVVHKPSEFYPLSPRASPPVVHKPSEVDPESIDKLCAEIYERKRMKETHLKANIQRSL